MTARNINIHGDVTLFPSDEKPPESASRAKMHIIESSEVSGNRHEVQSETEDILLWEIDGIRYLSCTKDYVIRHIGGDGEHGEQPVSSGSVRIGNELELDPWKNELRRVID
jgi:hypothetical protein